MSCKAFFSTLPEGQDVSGRAKLIDDNHPGAKCELETVSPHSDGPVAGEEYLHRYVFSPLHIHDGEVVPALFDDVKDKGLSCERAGQEAPAAETHERGRQQALDFNERRKDTQPEREYLGVVSSTANEVRSVVNGASQRAYAIYDTGLENNKLHVDIFEMPSSLAGMGKSQRKMLRSDLADKFTKKPRID